jgi:sec-independent protein translocase protein TatC
MSDLERDDAPLPLVAHLTELRNRLLRCVLAIAIVLLPLMGFSTELYTLFAQPLQKLLPEGNTMLATGVTSTFFAPFKLALVGAVLVTVPYLLYQIWAFIAPGLYRHEKRIAIPLLLSSVVLFYLGLAFAYFVIFPVVFGFFSSVVPAGVTYAPDISDFLDTALKLLFAFGFAFEIPIAVVLLIRAGVTTAESLVAKRPYVIVGCFIVAAVLTPPDAISQTMLALPMWLLFEAGIFAGRLWRTPETADEERDD